MVRSLILTGLGGAAGSMARYAIGRAVAQSVTLSFPLATFLINITGCFIIGLLYGIFEKQNISQSDLWLLLATGFCGGFTTFSTFALENMNLIKQSFTLTSISYAAASLIFGLLLCMAGVRLTT